jgi:hypothetical protein
MLMPDYRGRNVPLLSRTKDIPVEVLFKRFKEMGFDSASTYASAREALEWGKRKMTAIRRLSDGELVTLTRLDQKRLGF